MGGRGRGQARGATHAVRVLLVEDERILTETLKVALEARGVDAVAAPGLDEESVLRAAKDEDVDLVLLDYDLGSTVSLPMVRPLSDMGVRVLMLTAENEPTVLAACLDAGAVGVVGKERGLASLVDAVEAAADGRNPMRAGAEDDLRAAARVMTAKSRTRLAPFETLTPREEVVLTHLMNGLRAEQIAAIEFVSLPTVRSQIRAVLLKLGVRTQLAAVAKARDAGWTAQSLKFSQ